MTGPQTAKSAGRAARHGPMPTPGAAANAPNVALSVTKVTLGRRTARNARRVAGHDRILTPGVVVSAPNAERLAAKTTTGPRTVRNAHGAAVPVMRSMTGLVV